MLVLVGTGAIMLNTLMHGAITTAGIGLAFGGIVTLMVLALGPISGAHINPAVTLTLAFQKKLSFRQAGCYILYQITGALLASVTLLLLFGNVSSLGASLPAGPAWQSLVLEFFLSLILMLVIIYCISNKNISLWTTAILIGTTVGLEATFAGPLCGASMNPARSFAPALVSGNLTHHWLYWVGPIGGMLTAIPLWRWLGKR